MNQWLIKTKWKEFRSKLSIYDAVFGHSWNQVQTRMRLLNIGYPGACKMERKGRGGKEAMDCQKRKDVGDGVGRRFFSDCL
jgi:hypothetical protein